MSRNYRRVEKYIWSDMIISQLNNTQWNYQGCLITGPSSGLSVLGQRWKAVLSGTFEVQPETYTIQIGGSWVADDTLTITIGGTTFATFTAKASPTVADGTYQFSANGTGAVIVEDILAAIAANSQPTGWEITGSGDTLTIQQTTSAASGTVAVSKSSTAGTVVLINTQNYHADTILVGSTTFTCSDAETLSGNTFNPGTAESIVTRIQTVAPTVSGYTLSYEGNAILFTESTAGTGTAPTVSCGTANTGSGEVTISTDRDYRPAGTVSDARYELIPGDILILDTSKGTNGYDANGTMFVTPLNVSSFVAGTTVIAGFAVDYSTIDNGETDKIAVCTSGVQLVQERLPSEDAFGNAISYAYSANSLRTELESKNFRFAKRVEAGLY